MAESSVLQAWKTTVPCRFFANGVCREAERCEFLHEEVRTTPGGSVTVDDELPDLSSIENLQIEDTASQSASCTDKDGVSRMEECPTTLLESESDSLSDINSSSSISNQVPSVPVVCQYFQQGCCMFGDNCFNKHELISESSSPSDCLNEKGRSGTISDTLLPEISGSTSSCASLENHEEATDPSFPDQNEGLELKTKLRVSAPEFIPSGFVWSVPSEPECPKATTDMIPDSKEAAPSKTWAQVVNAAAGNGVPSPHASLCPYAQVGDCPYGESCTYVHGNVCEFCGNACLHPTNDEQRKSHTDQCIKQHEREMELAFAVARSKDKQCGVCFEVVVDKNPASEQRFGILPNCNHCFCLACIRKWRQAKQFENKIIRACPECRVTSDFVCPSMYWVDTKEEKDKLILAYKDALSNKQCKYFREGRGKCPFGNKCFYLHAKPDGTKVDTGPPERRQRQNADGETVLFPIFLWDFMEERDNRWMFSFDDFDYLSFQSGSDDSDFSDIEFII